MPVGINHLHVPGPTNTPEAVRRAMNVPMEDHRASDFPGFTKPLFGDLMQVFRLESGRVFLYPSSGTGAWEAAITNMMRPGDRALMSSRAGPAGPTALGAEGKWAIHLSQIGWQTRSSARCRPRSTGPGGSSARVREAERAGNGAAAVDGKMIDAASERMAAAIVSLDDAIHHRAGRG